MGFAALVRMLVRDGVMANSKNDDKLDTISLGERKFHEK